MPGKGDAAASACDALFQPDLASSCWSMSVGKQEKGAVGSVPESCRTQGAICDGPGSGGTALVCFTYPKEKFIDKRSFAAASFYVSDIQPSKTEKVCLEGSPDWFVINPKAATTMINHVAFGSDRITSVFAD